MIQDAFLQRKKDILSKSDKSSIGKWDEKIKSLCDKINKSENYYTTSSCSGRVILMIDQEKKEENLFLWVSHEEILFDDLKKVLEKLGSLKARNINSSEQISSCSSLKKVSNAIITSNAKHCAECQCEADIKNKIIKFKCEPMILHVACKDLESAKILLNKAKKSGLKHSGINSLERNIVLEINGSDRLEFPILKDGKPLVEDNFLKLITEQSNNKLKKSWKFIQTLEKEIK